MNQILDTGDSRNKKPANIKTIIRFFAIFLMLFAICAIGVAVYSIINKSNKIVNQKPEIQIDANIEEKILDIKIVDDTGIEEITYSLNGDEKVIIGNGQLEKDLQVKLQTGKNTFKIIVTDIDGEQKEYEELYEIKSEVKVEFKVEGSKVNADITSKDEISYITYRWNEEEEIKQEINNTEYTLEIPTPQEDGRYVLTLIVVDDLNNTVEKTKEVIIDKEPTLMVTRTNQSFIIRAEDDEKLSKAELVLNGESLEEIKIEDAKWEYELPFVGGVNKLIIRVYNLNGVVKERKVMVDTNTLTNE